MEGYPRDAHSSLVHSSRLMTPHIRSMRDECTLRRGKLDQYDAQGAKNIQSSLQDSGVRKRPPLI